MLLFAFDARSNLYLAGNLVIFMLDVTHVDTASSLE